MQIFGLFFVTCIFIFICRYLHWILKERGVETKSNESSHFLVSMI